MTKIEPGITGTVEVCVTPQMTAVLEGREIHPVCSTFWLAYYAEVAARRAIEPHLGADDDAVGSIVEIRHQRMAAVGCNLLVTATVANFRASRVHCIVTVTAIKTNTLIAEGIQEQVVIRKEVLKNKIASAVK